MSLFDLLSPQNAAETEPAVTLLTQSPNANQYNATRAAQRAVLLRDAKAQAGIPTIGSPQQESGIVPGITKNSNPSRHIEPIVA